MFPCNSCCHLAGPHPKLKLALSLNSAAPPTGNPRTPNMFWREALCVWDGWDDFLSWHKPSMPSNQGAQKKCDKSDLLLSLGSSWSGSREATGSTQWRAQARRCTWQPAPWSSSQPTAPSLVRVAGRLLSAACQVRPFFRAVAWRRSWRCRYGWTNKQMNNVADKIWWTSGKKFFKWCLGVQIKNWF